MATWLTVVTWTLVVYNTSYGTTHIEDIASRDACIAVSREYASATQPYKMRCIAVPRKVLVYR